ncbi:MAG: tetratricopeptide (TPR) repeat protein [Planctomycetota bacterium]
MAGDAPMHTDDNALLEFNAPRNMALYQDENALLERIEGYRSGDLDFLTGPGSKLLLGNGIKAVQATGLLLKAKLRINANRGMQGLEAVREAQALHPSNPAIKQVLDQAAQLAHGLLRAGRPGEGGPLLEALLQVEPRRPYDQVALGNLQFRAKRMRRAAEAYERALSVMPNHPEALYRLAYVLATAPDDAFFNGPRALELAQHSVSLTQSQSSLALRSLGIALASVGRFGEAGQAIDQALRVLAGPQERNNPGLRQVMENMKQAFLAGRSMRAGR